jgi:hypothetical protein
MAKKSNKPNKPKKQRRARLKAQANRTGTEQITAGLNKPRRNLQLHEWLDEIRGHAKAAADAGSPSGACLVPNPQTGGNDCVTTDEETCTSQLKGIWIGGPCGPD